MVLPAGDLHREFSRVRAKARIIKHGVDDYTGDVIIDRRSIDGNPNIESFEQSLDAAGWDEIEFHHWQKRGGLHIIKNGLRDVFESHHVNHNPESEWEYDFSGKFRPRSASELPKYGLNLSLPAPAGAPPPPTYGDTPPPVQQSSTPLKSYASPVINPDRIVQPRTPSIAQGYGGIRASTSSMLQRVPDAVQNVRKRLSALPQRPSMSMQMNTSIGGSTKPQRVRLSSPTRIRIPRNR